MLQSILIEIFKWHSSLLLARGKTVAVTIIGFNHFYLTRRNIILSNVKVDSKIKFKDSIYSVVGVDHYFLKNLLQENKKWDSFTLVNSNTRINISNTYNQIILWQITKPVLSKGYILNWNFSGTAEIKFQGDKGISEPRAELLWFQSLRMNKVFVHERFFSIAKGIINIETYAFVGIFLQHDELQIL